MKKWSSVVILAAITASLAAFSSCSSSPKKEAAVEAPVATTASAPASDSLNLGAASAGRAH